MIRAACAAMMVLPAAAHAIPIQVGPASYSVVSSISADRGSSQPPFINSVLTQAWNGTGPQSVTLSFSPVPVPQDNTEASGEAAAGALKSLAVAGGGLGFIPGANAQQPSVHVTNRAESTTFWDFGTPGGASIPSFSPRILGFDGELRGNVVHELLQVGHAGLRFGLDLIDLNGNLLSNAFTVSADLDYTPFSATLWTLSTSSTGVAQGKGWETSFTQRLTPSLVDFIHDFNWINNLAAVQVPTTQVVGIRYFVETEGLIEGSLVFSAHVGVDASNTALFEPDVTLANLAPGSTATRVLVIPSAAAAAPSPATAWLMLPALLLLARLRTRSSAVQAES